MRFQMMHVFRFKRAELDALIGNPLEFTGDARQQVARVVSRIDAITSAHPAAAQYKPHNIGERLR
jgi:adenylosuccinate lyase